MGRFWLGAALVAIFLPSNGHSQSFLVPPEPLSNMGIQNVTGPLETGYFFMSDNSSLLVEAVGYFMPPDTDMGPSCAVTIWDGDSGAMIHAENVGATGVARLVEPVVLSAGTRYIISMAIPANKSTDQYTFDLGNPDILAYNAPIATILAPAKEALIGAAPEQQDGTVYIGMPNFWVGNFALDGLASVTATAAVGAPTDSPVPTGVELPPPSPTAAEPSPAATMGTVANTPTPVQPPPASTSDHDKMTKSGAAAVAITTIICIGIVVGGILLHKYGRKWRLRRQEDHKHVFASNLSGVSSVGSTAPSGHRRFYDIEDPDAGNDTEMGLYAPSSTTSATGYTAAV